MVFSSNCHKRPVTRALKQTFGTRCAENAATIDTYIMRLGNVIRYFVQKYDLKGTSRVLGQRQIRCPSSHRSSHRNTRAAARSLAHTLNPSTSISIHFLSPCFRRLVQPFSNITILYYRRDASAQYKHH